MKVRLAASILKANDAIAACNRNAFRELGPVVVNMISSPGAGKTRVLEATAIRMKGRYRLAAIEGDVFTSHDAERIENTGIPAIQINTGGGCHLDANMVSSVLGDLPPGPLDFLFIENVGNLVCPAEFDLGEHIRAVVLSVTEGHDKPSKYPAAFRKSHVLLLNKIDLLPHTDFETERFEHDLREINPRIVLFRVSAKTGEGIDEWCEWLTQYKARESLG